MAADIRKSLRKLLPSLREARERGLSEADTVERVVKVLQDVLGYDPARELTRDKAVQHTWVDLAVKLGDDVPLLVEVVAAATPLTIGHVAQARRVAARDNISFILLTNGLTFNLYHIRLDEDLEIALAFTVDLSEGVSDEAAELLGLLHKRAVSKGQLQAFWEQRARLDVESLGEALFAPETLHQLRRILEKKGIRADSALLGEALRDLLSPMARRRMGRGVQPTLRPSGPPAAHIVESPDDASHIVESPD